MSAPLTVVVLAAGEGKRMRSARPKVLHEVGGRTLLGHVLAAVDPLSPAQTVVVVGHGREAVTDWLGARSPAATTVVQEEQRGTGDAVRRALDQVADGDGTLLVLAGDTPLLTTETIESLLGTAQGAAAVLLTAHVPDPRGYGRVLRDENGDVYGIVEDADAIEEQLAIDEINAGTYAFDLPKLRTALAKIDSDNAQGEEYLTDVVGILVASGETVRAVAAPDWRESLGVNDRAQLAAAGALLRDRLVLAAQQAGATIVDPATTWLDAGVRLSADCVVEPFTMLHGSTTVAAGAVVGPYSRLTDTQVGEGATVVASVCVGAEIGPEASVGPYTYLRAGSRLGRGAKAGGFVEMKNTTVGAGSKVPHLSYVGDAVIGSGSNVGAGTITCNYDGVAKHETRIGDDVFVGSGTMLVAPVSLGDGAYIAAGSAITEDVPDGALGIGRARQVNKPDRAPGRGAQDEDEGAAP